MNARVLFEFEWMSDQMTDHLLMSDTFGKTLEGILRLGLIDDSYPLNHACVQRPNGFYAINTVLGDLQSIFEKYDYDETMMPSVSTGLAYDKIPAEFKGEIDTHVYQITHTGLHPLEEPWYMQGRADLQMAILEAQNARSYRDLPIKRIMRGFRYVINDAVEDISLLTDTEQSAIDAVGIFATKAEYEQELNSLIVSIKKLLSERFLLSTIDVKQGHSIIFYSILPNNHLLEVARFRLFDQILSQAIQFNVLSSSNKAEPAFIFSFQASARLFVAILAAHSSQTTVVLPKQLIRSHVIGFNKNPKVLAINDQNLRVELVRFPYTPERVQKYLAEGSVFCVDAVEDGFNVYTKDGIEKVTDLTKYINDKLNQREIELAQKEKDAFNARKGVAIKLIPENEKPADGNEIIGIPIKDEKPLEIIDSKEQLVAKTFLALA